MFPFFHRGICFLIFLFFASVLFAREWQTRDNEILEGDLVRVFAPEGGEESAAFRSRSSGYLHIVPLSVLSESDRRFISDYKEGKIQPNGEAVPKKKWFTESHSDESAENHLLGNKRYGGPEKFAVLVGVNQYPNFPEEKQLRFCEQDIESLGETLSQNGFPPENVFVLTNKDGNLPPTKENIEHQISTLLSFLTPADTVVIAFSGHGVSIEKAGYFCPTETHCLDDTDPSGAITAQLVHIKGIYSELEKSAAGHKLFVVDACRDDPFSAPPGMRSKSAAGNIAHLLEDPSISTVQKTSLYVIASCKKGRKSIEDEKLGHGVFSYFFTDGLKGNADREGVGDRNGIVTTEEAFIYAKNKTFQHTGSQIPMDYRPSSDDSYIFDLTAAQADVSDAGRADAERNYFEAVSYRNNADYPKAVASIEKACALSPSDEKYKNEFEYIHRLYISNLLNSAYEAYFDRDYEESRRTAKQILSLDPDNKDALKLSLQKELLPPSYENCVSQLSESGTRKTLTVNGIDYRFCWCPPGEFQMGSSESEEGREIDELQHNVTLTKGFWLLETEVTQGMWENIMGTAVTVLCKETGEEWQLRGVGADYPIYYVTWEEAQDFCAKLSELSGQEIRLPSESEWEYACRAGTTTLFSFGNQLDSDKANMGGHLGRTLPVKSFEPNAWGLYDMHGNVWEWCFDKYADYPAGSVTDPMVSDGGGLNRVNRGGGWGDPARGCRSADRDGNGSSSRCDNRGFRILLTGEEPVSPSGSSLSQSSAEIDSDDDQPEAD